uniref:Reverse transcriptase domain-containing protein n=1 Tax=Tanacetum cinerariifolium TaxID=118510 RepID=A0A6L2MIZ1_TANCI|nr:reverse transcriptase domain-containing protein [Tanacetum cinerariifolium]
MKEMRDRCNKCGGPHPSSDCDDNTMRGPKEEDANYALEDIEEIIMVEILEIGAITYDPPVNPNAKPVIFLDDSKEEADEVEKEAEPLPKKPTHADPLPLKAYKPKISHP